MRGTVQNNRQPRAVMISITYLLDPMCRRKSTVICPFSGGKPNAALGLRSHAGWATSMPEGAW